MGAYRYAYLGMALIGLTSCGKPDASGIYVQVADREVTLVQLIQTPDSRLTGRLEETTIGADGTVRSKAAEADGSVSGHDLLLRPASVWYGGVQASGAVSGDRLTLSGEGFTLNAERSTLDKYQDAVAHLRIVADGDRRRLAAIRADNAAQAENAREAQRLAVLQRGVSLAADRLRAETARLNESVANCPDFGERAAANTARIAKMLQTGTYASGVGRGQLSVAANQVEVSTNQIEVARSQYALELNGIVGDAAPYATAIQKACMPPTAAELQAPCNEANSALAGMRSAITRGGDKFKPYKQQVRAELERQSDMIRQFGG